jgi:hypothetical protein
MIGFRAFLSDASLPFVSLLILLLITIVVIRSAERRVKASGAVTIVILVLLSANGVFRLVKQIGYRRALHNITADSVESVQVGDIKIQRHADVAAVINALRQSRWFTSEHGGWAEEVNLVIHFKSGDDQRYRIARYLRREGAVIDYVGQGDDSNFVRHYGYSFAEQLPDILQRLGAPLPLSKKGS